MKYLFYDLEFACSSPTHRICEFGYVITDGKFKVIEENNFLINPDIPRNMWEERVKREILKRPYSDYEKSLKFNELYEIIASKFKDCDYVFGHTNNCDALGLNDECRRYKLPSIDHVFYDIKYMYKVYINQNREVGLDNILKELCVIGEYDSHIAQNDAYNTMVALRTMIERKQISLNEFLEMCPRSKNKNENYLVESIERNKALRKEREAKEANFILRESKNEKAFKEFIINVQPTQEGSNKFKDKLICISGKYEKKHFTQMINLIQLIKNEGGQYTTSSRKCDIFVKMSIEENMDNTDCKRLRSAESHNQTNEKQIEFITFDELLKVLNMTEHNLAVMPLPSNIKIEKECNRRHNRNSRHSSKANTQKESVQYEHLTFSFGNELCMLCLDKED